MNKFNRSKFMDELLNGFAFVFFLFTLAVNTMAVQTLISLIIKGNCKLSTIDVLMPVSVVLLVAVVVSITYNYTILIKVCKDDRRFIIDDLLFNLTMISASCISIIGLMLIFTPFFAILIAEIQFDNTIATNVISQNYMYSGFLSSCFFIVVCYIVSRSFNLLTRC